MDLITPLLLALPPALLVGAAVSDVTTMTIPNWISGLLILAFVPAALIADLSLSTVAVHVGVAFGALVIGMGLFAMRVMGGGDVKLMAATCLWLGLLGLGDFVVSTAVVGGVLSLALLTARSELAFTAARAPHWVGRLLQPRGDIPYGVAIAVGGIATLPSATIIARLLPG